MKTVCPPRSPIEAAAREVARLATSVTRRRTEIVSLEAKVAYQKNQLAEELLNHQAALADVARLGQIAQPIP